MISAKQQKHPPYLTPEKIQELSQAASEIDADAQLKAEAAQFFARFRKIRAIVADLKSRRTDMGLSCSQAADLAGINATELRNLESSYDPDPPMSLLLKYAQSLGLEVEINLLEKKSAEGDFK